MTVRTGGARFSRVPLFHAGELLVKRLLTIVLLCLPALALADKNSGQSASGNKDAAIVQMEALAQGGIQEALKAVQRSGGFYPFAMVINKGTSSLQLVGYQGDVAKKPKADDFAVALFLQLRDLAEKNDDLVAAVVLKPFHATGADGKSIPGVWAAVDHRDRRPWVMFQPLIEQEPGRYTLGQMVYQQSEEAIFRHD
jgi:hypothetical protein